MNFRIPLIICLLIGFPRVKSQQTEPVKIGLLIQSKSSPAAKHGAELAVNLANKDGGYNGRPFRLSTREMEGPWGTGSKQAVDLIFEEEVWALLGSHDGRNAHLVEQASAKSIVTFVSVWSSDPSLAQAFIPWFFNCVPSDDQQAIAIIDDIYSKRRISKVSTITDNSYDANQSLKSFLKILNKEGKGLPVMFTFEDYSADLNLLADKINKQKAECIVLFCKPTAALKIVRLFRERSMPQPVFSTISVLNENELSEKELQEFYNTLLVPSGGILSGPKAKSFIQQYRQIYGILPGVVASYAFDGMNVLIEAIRTSGSPDREKIQEALAKISYEGVTGLIRFDSMGNRQGIPVVSPFVSHP